MSYDCVRFFENIPDENVDDLNLDDCTFILTDTILIFDHIAHKIKVVSNVHLDANCTKPVEKIYDDAVKNINSIAKLLQCPLKLKRKTSANKNFKYKSNISKDVFKKAVSKAKQYIRSGDIIQTVISQRFQA